MKKISFLLLVLFTLLMLFAPLIQTANAVDDISFHFTGHVTEIIDDDDLLGGAISLGDIITGTFTYDLDTAPYVVYDSYSALYQYLSPPYGITMEINDLIFETDPSDTNLILSVVNDHPTMLEDGFHFVNYNNIFPVRFEDEEAADLLWYITGLSFTDDSMTVLSNVDLPTSINPAEWSNTFWGIEAMCVHPDYGVRFYIIRGVIDEVWIDSDPIAEGCGMMWVGCVGQVCGSAELRYIAEPDTPGYITVTVFQDDMEYVRRFEIVKVFEKDMLIGLECNSLDKPYGRMWVNIDLEAEEVTTMGALTKFVGELVQVPFNG